MWQNKGWASCGITHLVHDTLTDELLEATTRALLPRPTTLRQCYSVEAIPPRQAAGSPTWVSRKGHGSEGRKSDTGCSGCSGGDAEEEGGRLLTVRLLTVKVCVFVCVVCIVVVYLTLTDPLRIQL